MCKMLWEYKRMVLEETRKVFTEMTSEMNNKKKHGVKKKDIAFHIERPAQAKSVHLITIDVRAARNILKTIVITNAKGKLTLAMLDLNDCSFLVLYNIPLMKIPQFPPI